VALVNDAGERRPVAGQVRVERLEIGCGASYRSSPVR
jgi:hypothetical protein